ncbi:MAG: XRE family transcriptional regulator [Desulfuromonadales bacterium]|nr:XRE family transcriptional regulator [Desulfuromonadales bacterium]MDT8423529.1 XRE family transcriptional regulator [Desulfuromonadales bacterium]
MKRPDEKEIKRLRRELFDAIEEGRITLAEATRMMRKVLGMNRRDYAEKVLKIGFETLQAVETGQGNPTLKTLRTIGAPFGLDVGFVRKRRE